MKTNNLLVDAYSYDYKFPEKFGMPGNHITIFRNNPKSRYRHNHCKIFLTPTKTHLRKTKH